MFGSKINADVEFVWTCVYLYMNDEAYSPSWCLVIVRVYIVYKQSFYFM